MFVLDTQKTVFIDVDDTLILWDGPMSVNYQHNQAVIDKIVQFKRRGFGVVVWSQGGSQWAKDIVEELQIERYVDAVLSKPDWFVDDKSAEYFMPDANWILPKE